MSSGKMKFPPKVLSRDDIGTARHLRAELVTWYEVIKKLEREKEIERERERERKKARERGKERERER